MPLLRNREVTGDDGLSDLIGTVRRVLTSLELLAEEHLACKPGTARGHGPRLAMTPNIPNPREDNVQSVRQAPTGREPRYPCPADSDTESRAIRPPDNLLAVPRS